MASTVEPTEVQGILLDIEGTTTPISFVHEVLFPYARLRVKDFLLARTGTPELAAEIQALRREHSIDLEQQLQPPMLIDHQADAEIESQAEIESMVTYLHWLIDRDRKSTALKSLQGKIWRQGYDDETLKAPVFADVAPALARWAQAGLNLSIFSSGSVLAQQLLFAHTDAGDLTRFLDAYFDTTSGAKTAPESYREIALAMRLATPQVLFISDVVAELDAANVAGMQTRLCLRPGNKLQGERERYRTIESFDAVGI